MVAAPPTTTMLSQTRSGAASRAFRLAVLAMLFAGLLAGCSARRAEPIRIGINAFPAYELLYLAQEKGFYAEEGVAVRIVEFSSLSDTRLSLESGAIDGAATTLTDLIISASRRRAQAGVVWVIDASTGGDMIVAREPVRRMADLKGRRVGLEADSLGLEVLARGLELAGLALDDVTLVALDQPAGKEALAGGRIDALVTYPPVATQALERPGTRKIFDTNAIPGEVVDVLAFTRALLDSRPDDVRRVLRAYERALAYLRTNEAEAIAIMAGREHIPAADFRAALREDMHVLTRREQTPYFASGGVLEKGIARGARNLRALGRVDGAPDAGFLRTEPAFASEPPGG
jgi:NitT/TauT family transport system substrate-binding protein